MQKYLFSLLCVFGLAACRHEPNLAFLRQQAEHRSVEVLQERFNVSYNNADMIARTELAHIQTQAAKKRYEDYGVKQVEIWADEDERRCEVCGKLHQKKYPIDVKLPIPAHPRCRCCVIPVVE